MSKKIIAVSLALFIIVTCFVACGKKYETTKINGTEVILVTDENGDPVINDRNQLIAVVTDRAGEVITYENGEDQTHYIGLEAPIEIKGVAYGENYKMNVLDGWTISNVNRINKDGTDNKCYIDFTNASTLKSTETFVEAFAQTDIVNEGIKKGFEDPEKMKELIKTNPELAKYENCKVEMDVRDGTFTNKAFPCRIYKTKIVDANGAVVHYAVNHYFLVNRTIYCVNYTCLDGVGYDESFDFENYLRNNFTYVD